MSTPNNCTTMRYKCIQSCSKPPTCFGLFRPSSERCSTTKKTTVAKHILLLKLLVLKKQVLKLYETN